MGGSRIAPRTQAATRGNLLGLSGRWRTVLAMHWSTIHDGNPEEEHMADDHADRVELLMRYQVIQLHQLYVMVAAQVGASMLDDAPSEARDAAMASHKETMKQQRTMTTDVLKNVLKMRYAASAKQKEEMEKEMDAMMADAMRPPVGFKP
jgi:hypothetical protein